METIWCEKFRPQKFKDIKGQKPIVDKVKAMVEKKNLPHQLYVGPAGVGKCVSGETPILLGNGEICNIEEAYKKEINTVYSLNKYGKICKSKISYFYKGKSDKLYFIKTKFGAEIKVTPEHPFLVLRKGIPCWIEAKDLKEDERIGSPEKLFFRNKKFNFKIPKTFREDNGYLYHYNWSKKSCFIKTS